MDPKRPPLILSGISEIIFFFKSGFHLWNVCAVKSPSVDSSSPCGMSYLGFTP